MAIRSVRVCDKPDCNNPFAAACPLCSQDCCALHIGRSVACVKIAILVGERPFGVALTGVCSVCLETLSPTPTAQAVATSSILSAMGVPGYGQPHNLPPPPPQLPLDYIAITVQPAVIEALRAYMVANALSVKGPT